MPARQTLPRLWLMTDDVLGERLWEAIERVPRGGGVVLRHHRSDEEFSERVAVRCRDLGLMLAVAGDVGLARAMGADMVHNPKGESAGLLVSRSVHSPDEAVAAQCADLVFLSPVFATASHPGATALGFDQAIKLARLAGVPAIALGGMDWVRGKAAIDADFHGWAAIRGWLDLQA